MTQNALIIDNIKALYGLGKDIDVAALLGVNASSVSHMRRGDIPFSPRMFLFLCIDRDMRQARCLWSLDYRQIISKNELHRILL